MLHFVFIFHRTRSNSQTIKWIKILLLNVFLFVSYRYVHICIINVGIGCIVYKVGIAVLIFFFLDFSLLENKVRHVPIINTLSIYILYIAYICQLLKSKKLQKFIILLINFIVINLGRLLKQNWWYGNQTTQLYL